MKKSRYVLFTIGLILAGCIGSLIFLHSETGKRFLVGRVKAHLESQYGLVLDLDEVDYNLLNLSFSLRGVSLGSVSSADLPRFLGVQQLLFDLNVLDLFLGRVTINGLRCEGAEVSVVLDETGQLNLPSRLQSIGTKDDAFGTDIVISSLIVTEGTFSLQDDSRGLMLEIPNLSLEVSGERTSRTYSSHLSTGSTSEFRVLNKALLLDQFEARSTLSPDGLCLESLKIKWDRSELAMVGTIPSSPSAEVDSEVTVSIDFSQLAHFFGFSTPVNGLIDLRLHLGNSIQAPTLEAQLTGEQLSWRGIDDISVAAEFEWRIKQARIKVQDALLSTPHGSLQGSGQVALTNEAGNSEARFQLSRLDVGWLGKFLGNRYRAASRGSGEASLSWPGLEFDQFVGNGVLVLKASQKTVRVGLLPVSGSLSFSSTRENFLISTDDLRIGELHLTAETMVQRNEGQYDPG
ncbi:MAG: AsmA family protein, partial [bacterium]